MNAERTLLVVIGALILTAGLVRGTVTLTENNGTFDGNVSALYFCNTTDCRTLLQLDTDTDTQYNVTYDYYQNGTDRRLGFLNLTGNSYYEGNLTPIPTLTHDIGSGTNRWNYLYVTNISADFITITDTMTAAYFAGDGSLLTGLTTYSNSTYNASYVPYTGATTNVNLGTNTLTTSCVAMAGASLELGQCGANARINITSAGNMYGVGPWDNDDSLIVDSFIVRNSRALPYYHTNIDNTGLCVFDSSSSNIEMVNLTNAGNVIAVGNITSSGFNSTADRWCNTTDCKSLTDIMSPTGNSSVEIQAVIDDGGVNSSAELNTTKTMGFGDNGADYNGSIYWNGTCFRIDAFNSTDTTFIALCPDY
jgi:hypothetical protein